MLDDALEVDEGVEGAAFVEPLVEVEVLESLKYPGDGARPAGMSLSQPPSVRGSKVGTSIR